MLGLEVGFRDHASSIDQSQNSCLSDLSSNFVFFIGGGLLFESAVSSSLIHLMSSQSPARINSTSSSSSAHRRREARRSRHFRQEGRDSVAVVGFSSVSLSGENGVVRLSNGYNRSEDAAGRLEGSNRAAVVGSNAKKNGGRLRPRGGGAVNTTKHLWAGAVAAMVSRTVLAPLERLKLEYIVRGEQKSLYELIRTIATSQGLKGFWRGNLVNVLRTAPFKAVNFCAYDTYRKQLLRLSGNEQTTNLQRFISGAAAGITATIICLPLDTIRTKMVAPGGEAFGGVVGAFRYVIQTEGFFSLYKGLVPSIISMAPAGAVFYGVYDILKSTYLRSPEGRKRIQNLNQKVHELNALHQLELGPIRTLLYGAISGACAEAATYPFEVVRRQLQMQVQANKLSALATGFRLVDQGGVAALYAGLIPSLLQVLPSAAISYFVYECMKIVLKVE